MVSKVSRSKVREEKHRRMRRHIIGTPERPRSGSVQKQQPYVCSDY